MLKCSQYKKIKIYPRFKKIIVKKQACNTQYFVIKIQKNLYIGSCKKQKNSTEYYTATALYLQETFAQPCEAHNVLFLPYLCSNLPFHISSFQVICTFSNIFFRRTFPTYFLQRMKRRFRTPSRSFSTYSFQPPSAVPTHRYSAGSVPAYSFH